VETQTIPKDTLENTFTTNQATEVSNQKLKLTNKSE
jgi:hypothetical protein